MTTQENIIALAEFVDRVPVDSKSGEPMHKAFAHIPEAMEVAIGMMPNPYTSADDCEAVIRKLNDEGFAIEIYISFAAGHQVELFKPPRPKTGRRVWIGDDYKHGVCELALKMKDD